MKFLAFVALVAAQDEEAAADDGPGGIRFCKDSSECAGEDGGAYDNGGCCNAWEWVSSAEDSEWGQFAKVWEGSTDGQNPGSWWGACMPAAYVEGRKTNDQGEGNNYEDLAFIKELLPDSNEFADVDE